MKTRHVVWLWAAVIGPAVAAAQEPDLEDLMSLAVQASQRRELEAAISRFTRVLERDPSVAMAWYLRGRDRLRAGQIAEAIADFDEFVKRRPEAENQLWERGIAYYYAGQYEQGARQFENYQKFYDQDVENAVWRYLCIARREGVAKAQATLLPVTSDRRVPMMEIYALFRGQLQPDEVLRAAEQEGSLRETQTQRRFYAHLYIGLWHEAAGREAEARKHIFEAEKLRIAHYMWDIAHMHAQRLRAAQPAEAGGRPNTPPR
jgi:lipoprotein NlpI